MAAKIKIETEAEAQALFDRLRAACVETLEALEATGGDGLSLGWTSKKTGKEYVMEIAEKKLAS